MKPKADPDSPVKLDGSDGENEGGEDENFRPESKEVGLEDMEARM
jgi:hypothetical protein